MTAHRLPASLSFKDTAPIEKVGTSALAPAFPCPPELRDKVAIYVIHDGNVVPQQFLVDRDGVDRSGDAALADGFHNERDWGAETIARNLAEHLGLDAYFRINIARVLLDFGRFPGSTPKAADHMNRFAINYPFSDWLSFEQKRYLLENYYDRISDGMDQVLLGKLLTIAIHTYDENNPSSSKRPALSIVTRSHGHQRNFDDPISLFDPLFPATLAEVTADRILRARIVLTLEEAGIHVADNYPYALPEGSVEVRSQVWYFFNHIRTCYDRAFPPGADGPHRGPTPRELVWQMLLDTNLRSSQSEALRSYLHVYRHAPRGLERLFEKTRVEYERVARFIGDNGPELVDHYRNSPDRPSSLLLEVRKDLVWNFDRAEPNGDEVHFITSNLAAAFSAYLSDDRPARIAAFGKADPRYS